MSVVHVVLPNDIDDPAAPSGGNAYDRRLCDGLVALGWTVRERAAAGAWPTPSAAQRTAVARLLATVPDGDVVLLDGLVASAVPEVLGPERRRLRLVVLLHMPLWGEAEDEALAAARAVVTTSAWTRRELLGRYALPADRVHVAEPGVDPAPIAPGSAGGGRLLCVAAVAPHKGHDVLVEALAAVAEESWSCVCVGALDRDAGFVDRLRTTISADGLTDRVRLVGPRTGPELDAAYAAADLAVLASRGETYGMVVAEALARGIPVLATAVGGVSEALGTASDGAVPGFLVEPGDPAALAGALRRWLGEPGLRHRWRRAAADRRTRLPGWSVTAQCVATVLKAVA
jgi:glycosyltransferase involved in cell wall biosynthesis